MSARRLPNNRHREMLAPIPFMSGGDICWLPTIGQNARIMAAAALERAHRRTPAKPAVASGKRGNLRAGSDKFLAQAEWQNWQTNCITQEWLSTPGRDPQASSTLWA